MAQPSPSAHPPWGGGAPLQARAPGAGRGQFVLCTTTNSQVLKERWGQPLSLDGPIFTAHWSPQGPGEEGTASSPHHHSASSSLATWGWVPTSLLQPGQEGQHHDSR